MQFLIELNAFLFRHLFFLSVVFQRKNIYFLGGGGGGGKKNMALTDAGGRGGDSGQLEQPKEGPLVRQIAADRGGGSGEQRSTLALCAGLKEVEPGWRFVDMRGRLMVA